MINYVIATHGTLGEGFLSSLSLFLGETENIDTISAYMDNESIEDKVEKLFRKYGEDDVVVVFTDMYGGSINQYFSKYLLERENTHVVTGINLGLIMEVIMQMNEEFDVDIINNALEASKGQILYMNDVINGLLAED